jgi:antitoxin VapB
MMTQLAKVFLNGRSQAIRIPKEFRVESDEVYIEKVGDTLVITPKKENHWDSFSEALEKVDTSDFMKERTEPPMDKREELF